MKTIYPKNYKSVLSIRETQTAIRILRDDFRSRLCKALNLERASAPLFVESNKGLNDDLNGFERPIEFDVLNLDSNAQIVHSLAKWKRVALQKYGFSTYEGIITNMNAIRRDEELDNIHSIYVDQWDWEKIITDKDRTISFLKEIVNKIVNCLVETQEYINSLYKGLSKDIVKDVTFITSQELEDLYPNLTSKEREYEFSKLHKTIFIIGIGNKLKSGLPHDSRAPDYDDWSLNGDLIVYNSLLDIPFEISSMGIRVNKESLLDQLNKSNHNERICLDYHQAIISNSLPLTIGGGIGQSRLCMLILNKAHIGEVQSSLWDKQTIKEAKNNNINLL